jgi:hypothetical protein
MGGKFTHATLIQVLEDRGASPVNELIDRLNELFVQLPLGRFVSPNFIFVDRIARDDFAMMLDQFFDGFWRQFEGQLIPRFEVHINNVSFDVNHSPAMDS